MKHTIHDIKLTHGARLLAIDVPNAMAASFSVASRAGYFFAPKEKYELPHLLEHLAFSGNKKYPDLESFMFEIERTGAMQNASTSPTTIRYFFNAPRDELKNVIQMTMSMVATPLFRQSAIKHEIEVIRSELTRKIENDALQTAMQNDLKAFPNLVPLERRLESMSQITRTDVVDYHRRTHGAANLSFVVATDFSNGHLAELEKLLNKELSGIERGKKLAIPAREWGDFAGKINVIKPRAKKQNYFSLSFFTPEDGEVDAPHLRMFHGVYNRGMGARLFIRSRQKGLSYGSATGCIAEHDHVEFYIDDKTTPEKFLPLFEVCIRELVDLLAGNISAREFERAHGFNIGGYELAFQRPTDFTNWYGQDYVEGRVLESPAEYLERLRAVKKDDLATIAKKYIRADNWILSLCGNDLDDKKGMFEKVIKKYIG